MGHRAGRSGADGVIGLFDNGVTTLQYLPTGNLQNGSDLASLAPTNAQVPFFFLSLDGNEYAYAKAVYLSSQIAGFDFGLQYAPNTTEWVRLGRFERCVQRLHYWRGHRHRQHLRGGEFRLSFPVVLALGSWMARASPNQMTFALRYQGTVGGAGVYAYAAYGLGGRAYYTGATTPDILGTTAVPRQQVHRPV